MIRGYPSSIDLSEVPYENVLINGPFQCRSLVVDRISLEYCETTDPCVTFQGTKSVKFFHTNCETIGSILNRISMEEVESIVIESVKLEKGRTDICQRVWSMIGIDG